jgi:hypothetical protein
MDLRRFCDQRGGARETIRVQSEAGSPVRVATLRRSCSSEDGCLGTCVAPNKQLLDLAPLASASKTPKLSFRFCSPFAMGARGRYFRAIAAGLRASRAARSGRRDTTSPIIRCSRKPQLNEILMNMQSRTRSTLLSLLLSSSPFIGLTNIACSSRDQSTSELEVDSVEQASEGEVPGGNGAYWVTGVNGQCHSGDHSRYTDCYLNADTNDYSSCVGNINKSNYRQCEKSTGQFNTCDTFCPSGSAFVSSQTSPICSNGAPCCRTRSQITCKQSACGNGIRESGFPALEQCDDGPGNTNTIITCAVGQTQCSNCSPNCKIQPGIPLPAPKLTVTLDARRIDYGGTVGLNWTSENVSSCTRAGISVGISGSTAEGPLFADTTYSIECSGAWGSIAGSQTVSVTSPLCQIAPQDRYAAAGKGESKDSCENAGMCWNSDTPGTNWCFLPKGSCNIKPEERINGGWPGMTPQECISRGMCWNSTQKKTNWCYQPR